MPEDEQLRALPLADRLRIAAVDLAVTGAPRALVEAVCEASEFLEPGANIMPVAALMADATVTHDSFSEHDDEAASKTIDSVLDLAGCVDAERPATR